MARTAITSILSVGLALLATTSSAQLFPGSGSNSFGGSDRPRPLPMEQAFPFFVSIADSETFTVTWQIAPDHYLYHNQFGFSLQLPGDNTGKPVTFDIPPGIAKHDQFFGDVEVYYEGVTATLKTETALPSGTSLIIQYQGCAEWGFCYPPQSTSYPLTP